MGFIHSAKNFQNPITNVWGRKHVLLCCSSTIGTRFSPWSPQARVALSWSQRDMDGEMCWVTVTHFTTYFPEAQHWWMLSVYYFDFWVPYIGFLLLFNVWGLSIPTQFCLYHVAERQRLHDMSYKCGLHFLANISWHTSHSCYVHSATILHRMLMYFELLRRTQMQ